MVASIGDGTGTRPFAQNVNRQQVRGRLSTDKGESLARPNAFSKSQCGGNGQGLVSRWGLCPTSPDEMDAPTPFPRDPGCVLRCPKGDPHRQRDFGTDTRSQALVASLIALSPEWATTVKPMAIAYDGNAL
jgi:hypothetical protein